ncbi:Rossmann fold domain-containing protein [Novosphingobium sp. B 225]|uniref:Rossmann fold domain-containing protein n=1 Tax=Novosphingobium sp. B 225 TaxID=1961849 RepID=UPI0020CBAED6|nr:hypothetical protein [Novosphingobium sp. B 225]
MQLLRVTGLPAGALAAAAEFYARVFPPLNPPPEGEDLLIVFPPADHTHQAWRLAAVQQLARDWAPARVNAVASASEAAIAAAAAYLDQAPGLTGQVLELDDAGAGAVVSAGQ